MSQNRDIWGGIDRSLGVKCPEIGTLKAHDNPLAREGGHSLPRDATRVAVGIVGGPTRGVVAAGDEQTSEAGGAALRAGGNAVDAAVGAAFAAFVCEFTLASALGGGVMLVSNGKDAHAMDFFAKMPGLGGPRPETLDFRDVEVDFGVTTQTFHIGRGSVALPLVLPGLVAAQERWGKLPLGVVLEPAILLARDGYVLSGPSAYVCDLLKEILGQSFEAQQLCTLDSGGREAGGARGTRPAKSGDRLRNADFASTLEAIAHDRGVVRDIYAKLANEFGPAEGGLITERDIATVDPRVLEPIAVTRGDWRLWTMPAPSTGGALIALGLQLLAGAGDDPFLSPAHVLRLARAQEQLLGVRDADFDECCRDAAFVRRLLQPETVAAIRAGTWKTGPAKDNRLGSTTHISVLDEHGGAASLTVSNGEGSGYVLSGTGMHVNNMLGEEDIHPRGFHVDPPGFHLRTMMAPTIVASPHGHELALGSGGSNRLRNAILAVLSHVIEHGQSAKNAVDAPRLHLEYCTQSVGSSVDGSNTSLRLAYERPGLSGDTASALCAAHPENFVEFPEDNMYFGGVHLALRDGSRFVGAGDHRRGGSVCVV